MMRIYKEFTFEAAHFLPSAPKGHPNSRIHGHSFRARVTLAGEPDVESGLIMHFSAFESALRDVQAELDHHFLNEIEGLEQPTLENLCGWIWRKLEVRLPGLYEVEVTRPSCQEGAIKTRETP